MAKKININSPKSGLNRDSHPSQLSEAQYSFALNANIEDQNGNFLNIQNDKSNILANHFHLEYDPENDSGTLRYFKVINVTNDIDTGDTYIFLVEPISGVGQFGVLRNNQNTNDLIDATIDCDNCEHIRELAEPLETLEQVELQAYETLISDACHIFNGEPEKGFNFTVKNPIKKAIIKNEKLGKTIYFDQVGNPPRYINIDKIDKYFTEEVPCDDDQTITCANFDKMRVFQKFEIPDIIPISIELGGNLKMGVYEFLVAYCDASGNEISEYFSITNPISIFDKNNTILAQPNLADRTNFAIRLDVSGLDKKFQYYKVAVIQTADIEGASRYFIEGVHTTNDTTIVYSTEQNKVETSIDNLAKVTIKIEEAEIVATANNILYHSGVTAKKEINLQPVVNLMGEYLKWQTHIATEDLYENGVNNSLFLSYPRDEVVPFGIRFLMGGGIETPLFPFIGRLPNSEDLEIVATTNEEGDLVAVDDNPDVASILNNTTSCLGNLRTKKWQYYNTATVGNDFCGGDFETIDVIETVESICETLDVAAGDGNPANNTLTIPFTDAFTDLVSYINDNKDNCESKLTAEICDILSDDYSSVGCALKTITINGTSGSANININETDYLLSFNVDLDTTVSNFVTDNASDILATTGATIVADNNQILFYNASPDTDFTNLSGDLESTFDATFSGNCFSITEEGYEILAYETEGETYTEVPKVWGVDYANISPPENNNMYVLDSSLAPVRDTTFEAHYSPSTPTIYKRDSSFTNEVCGYAATVLEKQVPTQNSLPSYFHNYYFDASSTSNLVHTPEKTVGAVSAGFQSSLQKGALWFKGKTLNRSEFILDVSKQKDNLNTEYFDSGTQTVRLNIFKDCSATTAIFSIVFDLEAGSKFLLKRNGTDLKIYNDSGTLISTIVGGWFTNGEFLIAIDNKIESLTSGFATKPTKGVFTVSTRNTEIKEIIVTWDDIKFKKVATIEATCAFQQPVVQSCTAVPYKNGGFAYWESQDTYPDNNELYDSTILKIRPTDLPTAEMREIFENAFADPDGSGGYTWKESEKIEGDSESVAPIADFTCRNIRHFRFPDNAKAPFMSDIEQIGGSNSLIYPLGVTINEEVINAFLDIAVKNEIISKEDREAITAYEIVRGDLNLNRSIVASGLLYDMRKYQEKGKTIDNTNYTLYPNYPFNSMREDIFNRAGDNPDSTNFFNDSTFGISNNNYTFHSPETDYNAPTLPSEVSVQGYMYGQSTTQFNEVLDHPKWVILTETARTLATSLAILEVATDIAIIGIDIAQTMYAGFTTNYGTPLAIVAGSVAAAGQVTKFGKYRYDWLKIFRDLGTPHNFAYYSFGVGKYNYLKLQQEEGQSLRGLNIAKYLKEGRYKTTNEVNGSRLDINNIDRERSVFLATGDYSITYPNKYKTFDKDPSNASLTYLGEKGLRETGLSSEVKCNIASPYVYLKNYLPQQHGTIDSIRWLTTGYRGDLTNPRTDCLSIFGGDTYISRHTLKRKHPQFLTTSMGQADRTPFNYYFYNNIGRNPYFFVSYNMDIDFTSSAFDAIFPDISDTYRLDTLTKNTNYVRPPSKFYLYHYGIPSFLCETRINTNYRYAEKSLDRNFYPQVGDVGNWTQEKNVSMKEPNYFFYNKTYSKQVTPLKLRSLSGVFKREVSDKTADLPNGIIASLPDNSENSTYDPWLVYRPLDRFEFPTNYGKLKDLVGIENEAILARFENTWNIYNKVDYTNDDGQSPTKSFLGGTVFFQRRSSGLVNSQLGFGGTQNTTSISCEFGHYHVDAKRGQVIHIQPGGGGIEEISSLIGGKPSGMRQWFKEHLPFKVLKYIKNVDIDNNYNGIGISMGYDSRYRRIFITKKDYIPLDSCIKFSEELGFHINNTECNSAPQIPTCPEGYVYNETLDICEKAESILNLCPEGYTYDEVLFTCTKVEFVEPTCCIADVMANDKTICSGDEASVILSSTAPNISYTWTVVQSGVTGAIDGGGSIINDTIITTGTVSGTATYTITPIDNITHCLGESIDVVVTVRPTPVAIATPSSETIESGDATSIALSSNIVGTVFTWTVIQDGVLGATNGSGNSIIQTLTGLGTVTYTVTPTLNGCSGEPIDVIITVEPASVPCGGSFSASGASGIYYTNVVAGTDTGTVGVTFDAQGVPDRLQIIWDGNVVADSLFIGDNLFTGTFVNDIKVPQTMNKYIYNGATFDSVGTENVAYTDADITNSTSLRSAGSALSIDSLGTQIGVDPTYSPTDSNSADGKAFNGDIRLTFNKTAATPTNFTIKVIGMSGTAWDITNVECPS